MPRSMALSIVWVDASTAAPIFVTAPEFSICKPLSAFGQSAISPIRKSSFE